jgi:hypothetical protein
LSKDLIQKIQQLLILGKGDRGRLEYILDLLQKEKIIPDLDQKYLQVVISTYLNSYVAKLDQNDVWPKMELLQNEIWQLKDKIQRIERNGFEKYVGRKVILFLVTVFVGWNALQSFIMSYLSDLIPAEFSNYLFPLNLIANYLNYQSVVGFVFLILLFSWPFIGIIHLVKFINSRKISSIQ